MEYAPDNLDANRILGGTAYRQLTLTSNRMYAVWAAKVYTKIRIVDESNYVAEQY